MSLIQVIQKKIKRSRLKNSSEGHRNIIWKLTVKRTLNSPNNEEFWNSTQNNYAKKKL